MTKKEAKKLLLQAIDLYQQGELDKVIDILCKIQRKDSPEQYAKAQLNLGVVLAEQGEMKEAITAWSNITREDSPEPYAQAQFDLGIALEEQGDIKGAISAWRNITRADSPEPYARAQLNLGATLEKQGNTEEAIAAWRNITREDSPKMYVLAQLNLGVVLEKRRDTAGAISAWRDITHEYSPEVYAQAQFNLGIALGKQRYVEEEIAAYRNIIREDSPETYAQARFNLGITLGEQGDIEGAIAAYRNITHEDSPEMYAQAQLNLGTVLAKQGETKEAITTWRNITREDFPEVYAQAQFNLGVTLEMQGDIAGAKEAFLNSRNGLYYQSECRLKILDATANIQSDLYKIYNTTRQIINSLFISEDMANNRILKVAHYTSTSTALEIIAGKPTEENEFKGKPSSFRLSTIKGVNDPKEGIVLYEYIQKICNFPSTSIAETANPTAAVFISCFTFNHDSLNQFRLYGKEDGREASGVSLIFNQDFFGYDDPLGSMVAVVKDTLKELKTLDHNRKTTFKQKKIVDNEEKLKPLPLYHCIYLDPHSGYLSIAQRDKSTFYAEEWYGNKKASYGLICKEAEKKWKNYQKEIIGITQVVKRGLLEIAQTTRRMLKKKSR